MTLPNSDYVEMHFIKLFYQRYQYRNLESCEAAGNHHVCNALAPFIFLPQSFCHCSSHHLFYGVDLLRREPHAANRPINAPTARVPPESRPGRFVLSWHSESNAVAPTPTQRTVSKTRTLAFGTNRCWYLEIPSETHPVAVRCGKVNHGSCGRGTRQNAIGLRRDIDYPH